MKITTTFLMLLLFLGLTGNSAWGQTNPTAQSLPYSQDFSELAHSSTTYPDGWQGWTISTTPGSSFNTGGPTANRTLTASGSASSTTGNVYNFEGKIGYLNTGSLDLTVVLAINTTGFSNVMVDYEIMTIRNPYNGTTNTRINEVTLQYRVGESGVWTSLTGIEYQNNTETQTGSGVTTPQNLRSKSIVLPSECDNQSVVQLRWASREVSGSGSRPSFAVDNVTVSESTAPSITLSTPTLSFGNVPIGSSSEQSYTVSGINLTNNIVIEVTGAFEISTISGSGFGSEVTLPQVGGSVEPKTVYVRFSPEEVQGYLGSITHKSTNADEQSVSLSGMGTVALATEPTLQASNVEFSNVTATSMTVSWTVGNGASRIVLARAASAVSAAPVDGNSYTASSVFGSGDAIGSGNFVVFVGSGSSVTVSGLSPITTYHVAVYEFNGENGAENYLSTSPATGNQTTTNVTFFSVGSADATLLSSWNSERDGSGSTPSAFTLAQQTFRVQNGHAMTASALWTVSGSGSRVVIEAGGRINSGGFNHSILLDLESGAEYNVQHTGYGSLSVGTWDVNSTIRFTNNGISFRAIDHPNVILDYTGTKSLSGTLTVLGDLSKLGTGTFNIAGTTVSGAVHLGGSLSVGAGTFSTGAATGSLRFSASGKGSGGITVTGGTLTLGTGAADEVKVESGRVVELHSPISIGAGSTLAVSGSLMCGPNTVSGNGNVLVEDGAVLGIGSPQGISGSGSTGNIQVSGLRSFSPEASYIFNGAAAQETGNGLPSSVKALTIANNAGVTLSQSVIVEGTLTLLSGSFHLASASLGLMSPIAGTPALLSTTNASSMMLGGSTSGVLIPPSVTNLASLVLNNSEGTTLQGNLTLKTSLILTEGVLVTNGHTMILGPTANVQRTIGYVDGAMTRLVPVGGNVTCRFDVGANGAYAPMEVLLNNVTLGGALTVRSISGDHPELASAGIDVGKKLKRYWTAESDGLAFDTYDATFSFVEADVDEGAHPELFVVRRFKGAAWAGLNTSSAEASQVSVTGGRAFSDFAVGEAFNQAPSVTSIHPSTGARLQSLEVTINGGNFIEGVTAVDFGEGIVVEQARAESPGQLIVTINILPNASLSDHAVRIENPAPGGGEAVLADAFTVVNPAPTLTAVTPNRLPRGITTDVIITGINFIEGLDIDLGGEVTIHSVTFVGPTEVAVSATASATASLGARTVSVTISPPGGGQAFLEQGISVTSGVPASIVLVSGDGQSAIVGTSLASPFVVRVNDALGDPVEGAVVSFEITNAPAAAQAFAMSSPSVQTGPEGEASSILQVGTRTGLYGVTAAVEGVASSVIVQASGMVGAPTSITLHSGDQQTAQVGTLIPGAIVVEVQDSFGNPVPGFDVHVFLVHVPPNQLGAGLVASPVTTNINGLAETWLVLGSKAGVYAGQFLAPGLVGSPVSFSVTAIPGPPAHMTMVAGNSQSGVVLSQLSTPLSVRVTDTGGNPVSNVTVFFSIASVPPDATGHSLSSTTPTTDANGIASTTLRLGSLAGTYSVAATSFGLAGSPVIFVGTASSLTSAEESTSSPEDFELYQNYPNPFNPSTSIRFGLPEASRVRIEIYNMLGNIVAELIDEERQPGVHEIHWNAEAMPSAPYLVRIRAIGLESRKAFDSSRKVVLLR
jgi:hypothetical protein